MAITSISGPKTGQNFNLPQFYSYSTNDPEKKKHTHTLGGGFSHFNVLSSLSSLPFLTLVVHLSLRFLTFFEAQKWSIE